MLTAADAVTDGEHIAAVRDDPTVAAVLARFPGAEITDIRQPPAPAAAPAAAEVKVLANCEAHEVQDAMQCQRCGLAWDIADQRPSCEPMTFKRLAQAAADAADYLEQSEAAWTAGDPDDPDLAKRPLRRFRLQSNLKRAQEFRALARMVDAFKAMKEQRQEYRR
jgi:hypothetical protein